MNNLLDSMWNTQKFTEYIEKIALAESSLFVVAVKDTIGFCVGNDGYEKLIKLGCKKLNTDNNGRENHWKGYAVVIKNGRVIYEEISQLDGEVRFIKEIEGISVDVISSSLNDINTASICVFGKEYSCNLRGLNIVAIDLKSNLVVDSVNFDTHNPNRPSKRKTEMFVLKVNSTSRDDFFIRDLISLRERLQMKNIIPNEYESLRKYCEVPKLKVRFFFFGWYILWNSIESVVRSFQEDELFDVLIIVESTQKDTVNYFRKCPYNYVLLNDYIIEQDSPDIAIYNDMKLYNSHDSIKMQVFVPTMIINGGMHKLSEDRFTQWFAEYKEHTDLICVDNSIYYSIKKDSRKDIVIPTGNPKFDLIYEKTKHAIIPDEWNKLKDKKVVLWAFDHKHKTSGVAFDLYIKSFLDFYANNTGVGLVIRPHPSYPKELIEDGIWTQEDYLLLKKYCMKSSNIIWDESIDYGQAYSVADAVITDINCGITISALPLGVPVAVLERFDESIGQPQYDDVYNALYHIRNCDELSEFIKMISAGSDPMRKMRNKIRDKYVCNFDGRNGERIKKLIIEKYNEKLANISDANKNDV